MLNAVLLADYLTACKYKGAIEEMRRIREAGGATEMVINSFGGNLAATLDFVQSVNARSDRLAGVKIYRAESAAAFISLWFASSVPVEMQKDSVLAIHLGQLVLEASEIDFEHGTLENAKTVEEFREFNRLLGEVLNATGLSQDPKAMARLYGSNWLRLSAAECLERGLVKRLF